MFRFFSFPKVQNQARFVSSSLESHVDIIVDFTGDWKVAISVEMGEWAHFANAGEYNRRYLTFNETPAIFCTGRCVGLIYQNRLVCRPLQEACY